MFVAFADYCMQNEYNQFLPKFDGFERFVYDEQTYFQIRMERLKPIQNEHFGYALAILSETIKRDFHRDATTILARFKVGDPDFYAGIAAHVSENDFLKLIETCLILCRAAKSNGWFFDLHEKNYMMRGNTPVIVDPWICPRIR